ncbi:MAG: hypothetical protein CBC48_05810 [bacterium TMED88]|nr:MAG: hypothetical protein CBC48_05810 [bacterium TMED88]
MWLSVLRAPLAGRIRTLRKEFVEFASPFGSFSLLAEAKPPSIQVSSRVSRSILRAHSPMKFQAHPIKTRSAAAGPRWPGAAS